jgi:hypothetical protein
MYVLSCWAQRHKWLARIIIIIASCLLFLIAWIVGGVMELSGYNLSSIWLWALLVVGLGTMAVYPHSKLQRKSVSYTYRKTFDAILTCCSICIIVCISNQPQRMGPSPTYQSFVSTAHAAYHKPPVKPNLKQQKQFLKKWIKIAKAHWKQANDQQKTGMVVLAVILGLLLGFGVSALSCSIACNGSAVAALAVLLLGLTGVFFLCRAIIKGSRSPKKKPVPEPATGAI